MQTNDSPDNKIERLLERAALLAVPANRSSEEVWAEIERTIDAETKVVSMYRPIIQSIAASVLLIICFSLTIYLSENTISTGNSENLSFFLPDNSKVELNAATTVSYNKLLWYFGRSVTLDGEAFFEVQKGSRFDVVSGERKVSVLGTSFNVFSRNNSYHVACFTGKVKVEDKAKNQDVILTPGLSTRENIKAVNFNLKKVASWKHNEFYFNATPLSKVIAELERQFNVQIETENIAERLYTGGFKGADLSNIHMALDLVCIPMGLKYEIKNNTITIKSNNTFN